MGGIFLVTGGCRSGKSAFAQHLAESLPGTRAYVATAPVLDGEMRERIARHQAARSRGGWRTIEEQTDLAGVLRANSGIDVFLVDCLTLWVNNLMYHAGQRGQSVSEEDIARECAAIVAACRSIPATTLFVTNEVGLGIVPENELARRYRDLSGRCGQVIAAAAESVTLMVCGVPVEVKSPDSHRSPATMLGVMSLSNEGAETPGRKTRRRGDAETRRHRGKKN